MSQPANPLYAYVEAFVDELQRAGIQHIIICPGSRSTPLALAFAEQDHIKVWMHVDERSAAFFGLGMAKRLHQPVALLCTSGTAAANFLPAIVEAKLTHVPLLVLTADRPHELRDNGAPQSIDQNRLYGTHVKWFVEMALPEATPAALRYIRTIANRAVALSRAIPAGPVHLNFPFREPLTPEPVTDQALFASAQQDSTVWQGRSANAPYVAVHETTLSVPDALTLERLSTLLNSTQRGLLIVGPNENLELIEPLLELARECGYPVLADPLSQFRTGPHDKDLIISSYDAFLRINSFVEQVRPELIIRFGAMPTSKPVLLYMKRYPDCPHIVVDGNGGWDEPTQLATEIIHAEPIDLCNRIREEMIHRPEDAINRSLPDAVNPRMDSINRSLRDSEGRSHEENGWLQKWQQVDQVTRETLQGAIEEFKEPFEGKVLTTLAKVLPEQTTLYVGNSMPVRDLDTFFWGSEHTLRLMGNRGANGIDGMVSSALGASAATPDKPTVLVIGDLSFFHDLNGLLAARLHKLHLTIILINNDGGGIFSFLSQAAYPEHFEQLFGTPTGLNFELAVHMYGGEFQRVTNWAEFRGLLLRSLNSKGLHVIEIPTERASNVTMHRRLWEAVRQALQD